MIHKICFCLLLVMFLLACSTSSNYNRKLNSLIGQDEQTLLDELGKPSSQKMLPHNMKVLTYTNVEHMYVPSEFYEYNIQPFPGVEDIYYPFSSMYDYNPMQRYLGVEITYYCQTSFILENNIVKAWKWKGNNCVSR